MIFLIIVTVLIVIFLAVSYAVYRFGFYSPVGDQNNDFDIPEILLKGASGERIRRMISELNEIPYETVSIRSRDGLTLMGRYYHHSEGAPLNICCHGYRGTPSRDFSGGARLIMEEGHNLLMIEERAHLGSGGHTITFGVKERYDCLDWVDYALERFGEDTEIILTGISMGAATVLMAGGMELPEQVKGIIADCPYTEPMDIILSVGRGLKLPDGFIRVFATAAARIWGGFDINGASALEGVRNAKVPILLIHGEEDGLVPCGMSVRLHEAAPDKTELHTFPGADHGGSYLVDRERYKRLVEDFTAKVLGGK